MYWCSTVNDVWAGSVISVCILWSYVCCLRKYCPFLRDLCSICCPTWYPVVLIQEKNWCGGWEPRSQWSLGCSGRCRKLRRTGSRWAAASWAWRVSRSLAEAPSDAWKQKEAMKQEDGWGYRWTNAFTHLKRSDLEALSMRKMNKPTSVFKEKETTLSSITTNPYATDNRMENVIYRCCFC